MTKVAQLVLLGIVLVCGACGCAALNSRTPPPRPQPISQQTFPLERFVAEHNRNAELIQTLTARPTVSVAGKLTGNADGRLAMERPRNFQLKLLRLGAVKADIGSNDEEFWFWVQNDKDKSIYWCNYDDLTSSALPITYQPDWIMEALGLQTISREEAARIKVQPGSERGTTALVFPPVRTKADTYTRVMIVWDHNRRIKEYRILAGDHRTLLAQSSVSRYREYELDSTDTSTGDGASCYLPEIVRLDWKREQLALDVVLREVQLNRLSAARSAALFVEPKISGYTRVNLADLAPPGGTDSRTTVRRTLPPPEPRNGARLGRPAPLDDDAAAVPRSGKTLAQTGTPRTARSRTAGADSPFEELLGAPMPAPPSSDALQASGPASSRGEVSLNEQ